MAFKATSIILYCASTNLCAIKVTNTENECNFTLKNTLRIHKVFIINLKTHNALSHIYVCTENIRHSLNFSL